jgi:hypothetical protein
VPIALLAVPGVDLVVIVVLVAVMLARKRWVSDQPGPVQDRGRRGAGARDEVDARLWPLVSGDCRLDEGAVLFRNELVVADAAAGAARAANPGEVMCVGKHAAIVVLAVGGGARIEVAASADGRERAAGPFAVGGPVR